MKKIIAVMLTLLTLFVLPISANAMQESDRSAIYDSDDNIAAIGDIPQGMRIITYTDAAQDNEAVVCTNENKFIVEILVSTTSKSLWNDGLKKAKSLLETMLPAAGYGHPNDGYGCARVRI